MKKIALIALTAALLSAVFIVSCDNKGNEPVIYTVTFDSKGGSSVSAIKVERGEKIKEPDAPVRDGYKFVGWLIRDGEYFNFAEHRIIGDLTLYASWNEIFTVSFDSKGGSEVDQVKVENGEKLKKPSDPVRDGYTFKGWIMSDGTYFNFDNNTISSNMTLSAVWDEFNGVYVVTFDSDGGSSVESQKVDEGKNATVPEDPTKEGYDFRGWMVGEDVVYNFSDRNPVESDLTLKAKWTESVEYCTVIFDTLGGSAVEPQKIVKGSKATKPAEDPTYDGYVFSAWVTCEEDYEPFDFENETVSSDITLYADWSLKTYKVTFDSNGGSAVDSQYILPGETAREPDVPLKAGYKFQGWLEEDNTYFSFKQKIYADKTLRASWVEDSGVYTVTFDTGEGSLVPSQEVKKWGYAVEPEAPTRKGYNFVNWVKSDGSVFDFNREPITSNMKLTAVWDNSVYYTIYFNSDGGSYVMPQRVKKGEKAVKPDSPTKEGYILECWYDEFTRDTYNFNTSVESDVSLSAKWVPMTYQVAFDSNGGNEVGAETINAGGKAYKPLNVVYKDGHKALDYWTLDGKEYDFNTPVTGNIKLVAVWREYNVGDIGPAGGYIIYDRGAEYTNGEWRFLEVAPSDMAGTTSWGDYCSGTQTAVGTGKENTDLLVEQKYDVIAEKVRNLTINGYSDWFVPSKDELNLMYTVLQKNGLGNFKNDLYWTSSNASDYYAWFQNFANGRQDSQLRSSHNYVRPLRRF